MRRRLPDQLILVLTANPEADVARRALDAGADGYLIKRGDGAELVHAIRTLLDGSGYINDDIGREVVSGGKVDTPVDALSPRERHVLALIAAGHGNREIADQLSISVSTVRKHRENLMQKLDLHNIAEV
ncbi:LuxR C-terminal-related transcriptional regulator [Plasticicumulans sp.]|uniref:LuxR C-terminal-related transcriptional regulator n=1 Tax=Plasticicumulans sp. TaxID=2307179 RepID=UPI003923788C